LQVVARAGHIDGYQDPHGGLVPPAVPEPANPLWWPRTQAAWAQFCDETRRDRHADHRERVSGGGIGGNLAVGRVGLDEAVWPRYRLVAKKPSVEADDMHRHRQDGPAKAVAVRFHGEDLVA
jgi:hypothetical protein